jgi:hypothetical protein
MTAWRWGGRDNPVPGELPVTVRRNAQPFPVVWGSGNDHGVDRGGERRAKGNCSGCSTRRGIIDPWNISSYDLLETRATGV